MRTFRIAPAIACLVLTLACEQNGAPGGPSLRPVMRPSPAPAADQPEWHYDGPAGPTHWGELDPRFATCGTGTRQSPIAIAGTVALGDVPALTLRFPPASLRIGHHAHVADGINNGHTIQITYDRGDTLSLGQTSYQLVQYHFHAPSEHTLSGRRFPMEMHLVHRAGSGALAVVGVLVAEGVHNTAIEPLWRRLPREQGVEAHYEQLMVDVDALLPTTRASYRYDGSLTTPPCTEGVSWIVLRSPIALSARQISAFTALIPDNSRPLQPLNGRVVLADVVE